MLPGIRAELDALRRRHSAALELMGERDEEVQTSFFSAVHEFFPATSIFLADPKLGFIKGTFFFLFYSLKGNMSIWEIILSGTGNSKTDIC